MQVTAGKAVSGFLSFLGTTQMEHPNRCGLLRVLGPYVQCGPVPGEGAEQPAVVLPVPLPLCPGVVFHPHLCVATFWEKHFFP